MNTNPRHRMNRHLIRLTLTRLAGMAVLFTACQMSGRPGGAPTPAVSAADSAIRAALAREQSIDVSTFPARAVAVAPFHIVSTDTSLAVLGYGLADFLMTDLARSGQVRVVERLRLDALLRELKFATSSLAQPDSALRFGKIVGARRIVMGSLVMSGANRGRLDGRVGDVASGRIESTTQTQTSMDGLLDAEKELAFAVFQQLGVVLTPAERAQIEQRPTRSPAALLAYSRGLRAEAMLNYQEARANYQQAVSIDPRFEAASGRLEDIDGPAELQQQPQASPVSQAGQLAVEGVNVSTLPPIATAADPAFRQRLVATILIVINLP